MALDPGSGTTTELCNKLDDDGDGQVDENCPCDPAVNGGQQDCYSGPPATRGTGICRVGQQRCIGDQEFRFWGACSNDVIPQVELPGDRLDNDCNGRTDENSPPPAPTCANGATNPPACTTSAAGTCLNGMNNPPGCTPPPSCSNGAVNPPACTTSAAGTCLNGMNNPPGCTPPPHPGCAVVEANECYTAALLVPGMTLVDHECYAIAYGASTVLGYCNDFTYSFYDNRLRALPLDKTVGCSGAGSAYTVSTAPSAAVIGTITQVTCWGDSCVTQVPPCLRRFRP